MFDCKIVRLSEKKDSSVERIVSLIGDEDCKLHPTRILISEWLISPVCCLRALLIDNQCAQRKG